jgi:hypothetical protein
MRTQVKEQPAMVGTSAALALVLRTEQRMSALGVGVIEAVA